VTDCFCCRRAFSTSARRNCVRAPFLVDCLRCASVMYWVAVLWNVGAIVQIRTGHNEVSAAGQFAGGRQRYLQGGLLRRTRRLTLLARNVVARHELIGGDVARLCLS